MSDLLKLAIAAHSGTSFVPEQRGIADVAAYDRHLMDVKALICEKAPADMADELYAEYAEGYTKRFTAWLRTRGRCMSTMIAGPARFPVRRQEKINRVERKRSDELIEYTRWARARIFKRIDRATRQADPYAAVRAEIEQMQNTLEAMKACNAIIRKKKLSEAEKIAEVQALGFSEATARKVVTRPDFAGRLGFPGFELTSLRGKIERRQATLRTYETAASAPVTETAPIVAGVEVVEDVADDRLRLIFPDKPSEETRSKLKRAGFRWSPYNGAWQRQLTANARAAAQNVLREIAGAL